MRAVDAPADSGLPAVRIQTAEGRNVPGAFRFVGTRGLIFRPTSPLPGSTRFDVTVAKGTPAIDGASMAADYSFQFETAVPSLVATYPATRPLRASEPIFLHFTQPIDPVELAKRVKLELELPGQKQLQPLAVTVKRGAPEWLGTRLEPDDLEAQYRLPGQIQEPSGKWLQVVPTSPLPLNSQFKLVIAQGLRSTEGPLPTLTPIVVGARSFGSLYATNLKCAKQNLGRCQAHRDFTAVFSNPVHPDEFRRYLRVQGPARQAKAISGAPPAKKKLALEHGLGLDPDYGDRFRITLQKGMTDVFGQKLEKDVSFELLVEEPFSKAVATAPSQASSEEPESESAEDGDPNAPRRPKLKYDLELGIRGHIVEAQAFAPGSNKALPKIPISAINVPTYGLTTTKLTEWSTIRWLNDRTAPSAFRPFTWITPQTGKNLRAVRPLELDQALESQPTGTTIVSLLGVGELQSQDTLINVTDLGLSARMSRLGSLVWVTRLSTGNAVAGATVTAYNPAGDKIAEALTDDQGVASFAAKELHPVTKQGVIDGGLLLVARANADYTYQRLEPARAASPPGGVDYAQRGNWVGLVFTDRSVYRPGETVKAGGFFRRTAESGFSVRPNVPCQYVVQDSNGEAVAVGESALDPHGSLAVDVAIGKSAALGRATLTVKLGRLGDEQFSVPFELLAYKPAEFKVAVQPNTPDAVHRQSATFKITAEYLFGGRMGEARVSQHVVREEIDYTPPKTSGYGVDDHAYLRDLRLSTNRGSAYLQDTKSLDANGELQVTVPLDAPEQSRPERLTLEAEVQDLSAQTQAARATVMVHPALYYVGLKAPKSRFLATGAALPIEVAAFYPQGERAAQVPVTLELLRRTWTAALEDRPAALLHHRTHVRDELRGACKLLTEKAATDCQLRLTEPGYYIVRATAQDILGNRVSSSYGVYATSDRADQGASPVAWGNTEGRELALELDQKRYQPGDIAKILVKSPFQEATALVTVERGGILARQVVALRGKAPVIEIPVLDSYFPNAFVSIHLLRGRVAKMPDPGKADVGAPDYRIGYSELFVDPESRRLSIKIATPKTEYHPGDDVDATLTLQHKDGHPLGGSVTFYVVDEGVLRLTGYKTPDPLPAFASRRTLGVFALESRDDLAQILNYRDGERISTLGFETNGSAGDKGYEGGGGGGELPGKLRSDFRTTVYFKAGQLVDKSGKAQFTFRLPDNLTSYRLMAVAAADEDRFGFGEATILANRPLMARPALPRHLRVGDQLQADVVVTSKVAGPVSVNVALRAQGLTTLGPRSQQVALAANGQARLSFPVKVEQAGNVSFEFGANAGPYADRVLVKRYVEQPLRWLTATNYGTTNKSVAIGFGDLRGYRQDQGELTVSLSNSALIGLKPVFDSLAAYPYGCTEQLTSRVLPLLYAPKLAELEKVRLPTTQRDDIDAILGELVKRVRYDGAVTFWEGDQEVSPWLAAYTMLALEQGSKSQYFVPKLIRDRLSGYLLRSLDSLLNQTNQWSFSDAPDVDTASTEEDAPPTAVANDADFRDRGLSPKELERRNLGQAIFVADALARTGQLDQPRLRRLALVQQKLALSSKIQLLHAMAVLRFPRQELDALLTTITKAITIGPAEARVEQTDPALAELLDSNTRSTAQLLEAVVAIDTKHPLAAKLARGLLRMRSGVSYRNTQDEAWVLLALEEYRKAEASLPLNASVEVFYGEQLQGSFAFHDAAPKRESVAVAAKSLLGNANANLTLDFDGTGDLNYAVELRLARDGASELPLDEGLSVEKLHRAVDSAKLQELAITIAERNVPSARLGQLVLVDLLLETALPRDRVVLDDPMPAGFEAVDFAFATTNQALSVAVTADAQSSANRVPPGSRYGAHRSLTGVHRELKDDRVVYFIPHLEPGIYHLRYLARATSPGKFVVPPTRASCMYEPEVFGQTRATKFEIVSAR